MPPQAPKPRQLYRLPKIHKPGKPLVGCVLGRMIVPLGEDFKFSALSSTPPYTQKVGDVKQPAQYLKRVGDLSLVLWFISHISLLECWEA